MSNGGESSPTFNFKLFIEGSKGDLGRIMDKKIEPMHERIDKLEMSQSSSKGSHRSMRNRDRPMHEFSDSNSEDEFDNRQ